jgi:TolB-like protein
VCNSLIAQCLDSPALTRAIAAKKGKAPTVIVGTIRNDSSEHMDTTIISTMMRNAIINDGRLSFVASGDAREEIRAERQDQQSNASESTAKSLANETGADFILQGAVKSIVEQSGGQSVRSYFVSAELVNTESNTLIWAGENNDVKKVVKQAKAKL